MGRRTLRPAYSEIFLCLPGEGYQWLDEWVSYFENYVSYLQKLLDHLVKTLDFNIRRNRRDLDQDHPKLWCNCKPGLIEEGKS
jgi:hypothetical protein